MSLVKRFGQDGIVFFEYVAMGAGGLGFDRAWATTCRTTRARHTAGRRIGATTALGQRGGATCWTTGRLRRVARLWGWRRFFLLATYPGIKRRSVITRCCGVILAAVIAFVVVKYRTFGGELAFSIVAFVGTFPKRKELLPDFFGGLRTRRRVFFEQAQNKVSQVIGQLGIDLTRIDNWIANL